MPGSSCTLVWCVGSIPRHPGGCGHSPLLLLAGKPDHLHATTGQPSAGCHKQQPKAPPLTATAESDLPVQTIATPSRESQGVDLGSIITKGLDEGLDTATQVPGVTENASVTKGCCEWMGSKLGILILHLPFLLFSRTCCSDLSAGCNAHPT